MRPLSANALGLGETKAFFVSMLLASSNSRGPIQQKNLSLSIGLKQCLNSGSRFYTGGEHKKRKLLFKFETTAFSDDLRS